MTEIKVDDGPPKNARPTAIVVGISSSENRSLRGTASHLDNQSGSYPRARRTCCLCGATVASHQAQDFPWHPSKRIRYLRGVCRDEVEYENLKKQLDDLEDPVFCKSHFRKEQFVDYKAGIVHERAAPSLIKQSEKVYSSQALLKHMTEKNVCDRRTRIQRSPSTDIYSRPKKPLDSRKSSTLSWKQDEEEETDDSFVDILSDRPAVTSFGRTVKRKLFEECEPTIMRRMHMLSPQHERENKILSKFHMPCIGNFEIPVVEPMEIFPDSEKMDFENTEEVEGLHDDEPENRPKETSGHKRRKIEEDLQDQIESEKQEKMDSQVDWVLRGRPDIQAENEHLEQLNRDAQGHP